jgi:hypothetical protein
MKKNKLLKIVPLSIGVFGVSLVLSYTILAWTEPTFTPPNNNVAAPLNTGSTPQTKSGGLGAQYLFVTNPAGIGGSRIEIGEGLTSNQYAYIDLKGDTTYTDYGFRLMRYNSGANSESRIESRGTGGLRLMTDEAGPIIFNTLATERLRIDSAGNVGIGTNSPVAKLDINGQIKITDGNQANGKILTSDANGLATWKSAAASISLPQSCSTGTYVSGVDITGKLVCSSLGALPPSNYACSYVDIAKDPATGADTGNRRIFVTSVSYSGYSAQLSSDANANAACQKAADDAKVLGTYKAMVYLGGADITTKIPGGKTFWTCDKTGGGIYKKVADSFSDLFNDDGGGVYLDNAINYDETGNLTSVNTWTGFAPNGSGGYSLLNSSAGLAINCQSGTGRCLWGCPSGVYYSSYPTVGYRCATSGCGCACVETYAWIGSTSSKSRSWAYNQAWNIENPGSCSAPAVSVPLASVMGTPRSLYCIEQ